MDFDFFNFIVGYANPFACHNKVYRYNFIFAG